ncbi:MAG TPA: M48 family metalloprotease [Pyrinomonadaceae bacterium]
MNVKKQLLVCLTIYAVLFSSLPSVSVAQIKIKKIKIRGYVTNVFSPTSFEIDEYKVTKDASVVLDFENQDKDNLQFKAEDIRVGTEIEVEGTLNQETDELTATKVTVDLEQFRKLKNTTVLTRAPEGIEKNGTGWQGTFWADGRRIRVEPETQVLFELNKTEKKEASQAAQNKNKVKKDDKKKEENAPAVDEEDEFTNSEPLKAVADVKAGMFVTYEGKEQPDGAVLAARVVFMKNDFEKGEERFWKSLTIKEKASNFESQNPGELKISQVGKFKLLPNQEVQEYVRRLGESLIPPHQKLLPAGDPQKIPFKFYVLSNKQANAFATANGIIAINSGMLMLLENEAQLAAVMAHEISHATQEHSWRQMNKDKGKRTAIMVGAIAAAAFGVYGVQNILELTLAAMQNGYSRRLENQADRIGLEYMIDAGYDPREAPRVWKLMAKKYGDAPTNFFWSSHSNNATRRSFLMVEIRNNYSQLDLNQMKKGDENEYQRIVLLTGDAAAKKKKIKVKA